MLPTGINIKIMFTWYELFSAVSLSNDPETISLVIPPYTSGEPLPQLSYITTDIRFRDTIFLDYVNSIIRKINNLITLVNDLIPLIYNTSLESASLSRWGAGKYIRWMHGDILRLEQTIVSLNNASISINDYMTRITDKLNIADIPPTENLNDLKRSVSDYNVFLHKLEARLKETHTKWEKFLFYLQKASGLIPTTFLEKLVGIVFVLTAFGLIVYIETKF